MKTRLIAQGTLVVILFLLLASRTPVSAIIGLQVSVVSSNAVLTWPCDNTGETYLIQYRSNLTSSNWVTLADFVPASGSNTISFVDTSNLVQYPVSTGSVPAIPLGFYRVVRDGTYLVGVTNGTIWTGLVKIPVELGNAYGDAGTMSLTENGDMMGNSIQPPGTTMIVDSTQMSNGVHQVSLSTSWSDTNGNYIEADSPPVNVIVQNEISFPDWMAAYGETGNSVVFQAVSAHTNADWQIDVYGSDYYYIGSFGGTTTDGNIQVVWNLVDPAGNVRTNDTFFIGVVTTRYDLSSGTSSVQARATGSARAITPKTYKQNDPWLGPGKFAIAVQHAFDFVTDHETLYSELGGFTGAANGTFGVLPAQNSDVPYAIPFSSPDGSNGDPVAGWAAFRAARIILMSETWFTSGMVAPRDWDIIRPIRMSSSRLMKSPLFCIRFPPGRPIFIVFASCLWMAAQRLKEKCPKPLASSTRRMF